MGARSGKTSRFRLNSMRACSLVSGLLSSWIHVYTCAWELGHKRTESCLIPRPHSVFFSYTASGGLGTRLGQHVHCSQVAFGDVFEVHVPAVFSASAKDGRLGARLQAHVHVD